ncbi:MAG: aminotransferase class V-fold PLP-dependent enzyme, partial [Janthinobacterium lividum]
GDKLLGGPQCGILVGTREVIDRVRANPLFRALRVDKLTYAALEATLLAYLCSREETIPVVAMLRLPAEDIRRRCEQCAKALRSEQVSAEVIPTRSLVGGGTTPGASLPSFALALRHAAMNEDALAALLRSLDPPVMARTHQGRVLLDLRTIPAQEDAAVTTLLQKAFRNSIIIETDERP